LVIYYITVDFQITGEIHQTFHEWVKCRKIGPGLWQHNKDSGIIVVFMMGDAKMVQKVGCLIVHGFGGRPAEVFPLADFLRTKGYEVLCPELKGHTGKRRDLHGVSYKEWIASAEEGLRKLQAECNTVVLIGFSMGGLIAVNLAAKHSAAALVTLNMPIYHWDVKRICINLLHDFRSGDFSNLCRYVRSTCALPLSALIHFKLILSRTKGLLKQVTCPVFVAQAMEDDTVQARSAQYIYDHVSSGTKAIQYYGNSGHLLCHSKACHDVFKDVAGFIGTVL
jgi:carboxylesterase